MEAGDGSSCNRVLFKYLEQRVNLCLRSFMDVGTRVSAALYHCVLMSPAFTASVTHSATCLLY